MHAVALGTAQTHDLIESPASVDALTVHPIILKNPGTSLVTPSLGSRRTIESHGPYQHGAGFPAMNGANTDAPFSALIPPPQVSAEQRGAPTGLAQENVFASEFGCVVMSSFESMSATLDPSHWGLHGGEEADNCTGGWDKTCTGDNPMAQRNYPCDNIIEAYFGGENQPVVSALSFGTDTQIVVDQCVQRCPRASHSPSKGIRRPF